MVGEGHATVAKYVPIVIGAGGRDVDAHDEVMRMLELDPSEPNANVPTFKNRDMPDRPAFTDDIRDLTQSFDGRNRQGTRRIRRTQPTHWRRHSSLRGGRRPYSHKDHGPLVIGLLAALRSRVLRADRAVDAAAGLAAGT